MRNIKMSKKKFRLSFPKHSCSEAMHAILKYSWYQLLSHTFGLRHDATGGQ